MRWLSGLGSRGKGKTGDAEAGRLKVCYCKEVLVQSVQS